MRIGQASPSLISTPVSVLLCYRLLWMAVFLAFGFWLEYVLAAPTFSSTVDILSRTLIVICPLVAAGLSFILKRPDYGVSLVFAMSLVGVLLVITFANLGSSILFEFVYLFLGFACLLSLMGRLLFSVIVAWTGAVMFLFPPLAGLIREGSDGDLLPAAKASYTVEEAVLFVTISSFLLLAKHYLLKREKLWEEKTAKLELLANTDPLTGVSNYRFFEQVLPQEMERSKNEQLPLSLCLLDVNDFKLINDRFGHEFGNEALKSLASTVSAIISPTDHVFRLGGDEFALLLVGRAAQEAERICLQIGMQANCHDFFPDNTRLNCSFGICQYNSETIDTKKDFLRMADRVLYQSKEKKRNGTAITVAQ